jgi:LmbE family N-acetylglucosaminyl deacetylase
MQLTAPSYHHDGAAMSVAPLGTVLGIWAHPDDEAYLSAGLMALATANGQRVVVAHATLGELGTSDPTSFPPRRLRAIRRRELERALHTVGVDDHHLLGHGDGTCAAVEPAVGIAQVASLIEQVDPDTIITFGPDGLTGHPDHQAVSRWTSEAWRRTGQTAALLHATVTDAWMDAQRATNEQAGAFGPGFPRAIEARCAALDLRLPTATLDRKVAALRAHRSQTEGLESLLGPDAYRRWWSTETFVAAGRACEALRPST